MDTGSTTASQMPGHEKLYEKLERNIFKQEQWLKRGMN
jgi:hypothetical protein